MKAKTPEFQLLKAIDTLAEGSLFNRLITLIAGASLVLAFAPFGYWYLILPGLVWLVLPLQTLSLKQTLSRGLWFNFGFYGAGLSWIHISINRFGGASLGLSLFLTGLLVFALSLFSTSALLILNRFFSNLKSRDYYLIALPFSWLLMEWVSTWLFTGFPWLNLGYSQIDGPLSGFAPILGSASLSVLVILISGLLALVLRNAAQYIKGMLLGLVALVLICVLLLQHQWVKTTDKTLTVSLIQPNISQDKKWKLEQRIKTLDYFRDTTETLDSELVIWPEGAIPALERSVSHYLRGIDIDSRRKSQTVITGIAVLETDHYYNAAIALGEGNGRYYKQHLLPFGEFIPLESLLRGLIAAFDLPMSSFSSGDAEQKALQVGDWHIAMALCYEIIFQDIVADQLKDADVLITLSNDAWFGDSLGAYQHLSIARMRALENGVPVIRATNDGISAYINQRGVITSKMVKFERGVLSETIAAVEGYTPFRMIGPSVAMLILFLILGAPLAIMLRFSSIYDGRF